MMILNEKNHYYYSNKINDRQFISGFGTRQTPPLEEILNYTEMVVPEQIHKDKIAVVGNRNDRDEVNSIRDVDGVLTREPGIVLSIQTADCVPIVFVDKKEKIVGISHKGWKGTLLQLAQKMIDFFVHEGSSEQNVIAVIGPSIGACCYDIGKERAGKFATKFPAYKSNIFEAHGGKTHLNLPYLNYLQLLDRGVAKQHIDFFPFCTKCNGELFYSFRRDGPPLEREMTNFVMMR